MTRIDHISLPPLIGLSCFPKQIYKLLPLSALTIARHFSKETLLWISTVASSSNHGGPNSQIASRRLNRHGNSKSKLGMLYPSGSCKIARTAKALKAWRRELVSNIKLQEAIVDTVFGHVPRIGRVWIGKLGQ